MIRIGKRQHATKEKGHIATKQDTSSKIPNEWVSEWNYTIGCWLGQVLAIALSKWKGANSPEWHTHEAFKARCGIMTPRDLETLFLLGQVYELRAFMLNVLPAAVFSKKPGGRTNKTFCKEERSQRVLPAEHKYLNRYYWNHFYICCYGW